MPFSKAYKANNEQQAEVVRKEYVNKRVDYCIMPVLDKQRIDTELVSNVLLRLHRGKAADVAGLALLNT